MAVFANFSNRGGFLKNAKPNVHIYPWTPKQAAQPGNIRTGLQQPHERSLSFATATVAGSGAAQIAEKTHGGSSGCGCGGKK